MVLITFKIHLGDHYLNISTQIFVDCLQLQFDHNCNCRFTSESFLRDNPFLPDTPRADPDTFLRYKTGDRRTWRQLFEPGEGAFISVSAALSVVLNKTSVAL